MIYFFTINVIECLIVLDDAWHNDLYFSLSVPGVVTVIGNGLVLLVYGQRRKKLRVHELMTINLAVCDFGYSLAGCALPHHLKVPPLH